MCRRRRNAAPFAPWERGSLHPTGRVGPYQWYPAMIAPRSYPELLTQLQSLLRRSSRLRAQGRRIDGEVAHLDRLIAELKLHQNPPRPAAH